MKKILAILLAFMLTGALILFGVLDTPMSLATSALLRWIMKLAALPFGYGNLVV